MLLPRKALSAEQLRRLAVLMVTEGDAPEEVADLLEVSERSVWRWLSRWRRRGRPGDAGLATRPGRGRPPKLTGRQAAQVLRWIQDSPCDFGFATERWAAPRMAAVIERHLGVHVNHRYLNDWLRRRGVTPQVPPRLARERDEGLIAAWVAGAWPGIKKRPLTVRRPLFSRTEAASCCSRSCGARSPRAAAPPRCGTAPATGTRCRSRRR
jgi:transposase